MKSVARLLLLAALLAFGGGARAGEPYSVLGEFTPSTSLPAGTLIERLPFEEKAQFTREVMRRLPIAELAGLFGLQAEWSYRSGGYQRTIAPNVVVSVSADDERVRAFALAWMYVYQQDAVPFFSAAEGGRPAMRLRFEERLTPRAEQRMFAALVGALGEEAGYTRTGEGEIVVLCLDGKPGFYPALAAFASAMRVAHAERFTAHAEYRAHDWRRDPLGEALLRDVDARSAAQLRSLRGRYEQFVARWLASRAGERLQVSFAR